MHRGMPRRRREFHGKRRPTPAELVTPKALIILKMMGDQDWAGLEQQLPSGLKKKASKIERQKTEEGWTQESPLEAQRASKNGVPFVGKWTPLSPPRVKPVS